MKRIKLQIFILFLLFSILQTTCAENTETAVLHFDSRNLGAGDAADIRNGLAPYLLDSAWSGLPRAVMLIRFDPEKLNRTGLTFQYILDQWPDSSEPGAPYAVDFQNDTLFYYRDRLEISPDLWSQITFRNPSDQTVPLTALAEIQVSGYAENTLNPDPETVSLFLKYKKGKSGKIGKMAEMVCTDFQARFEILPAGDFYSDHQLEIVKRYYINGRIHTLAWEVTGFQDKVVFINLYDYDLTDDIKNGPLPYNPPVFSDAVDQIWDEEGHPRRYPESACYNPENNMISVTFDNGEIQSFQFVRNE